MQNCNIDIERSIGNRDLGLQEPHSSGIQIFGGLEWDFPAGHSRKRREEHHHRSDLNSRGQLLKLVLAVVCLPVCVIEDRLACSYGGNPVENIVQFYEGWILRQNA
jgi:hypothetical protein